VSVTSTSLRTATPERVAGSRSFGSTTSGTQRTRWTLWTEESTTVANCESSSPSTVVRSEIPTLATEGGTTAAGGRGVGRGTAGVRGHETGKGRGVGPGAIRGIGPSDPGPGAGLEIGPGANLATGPGQDRDLVARGRRRKIGENQGLGLEIGSLRLKKSHGLGLEIGSLRLKKKGIIQRIMRNLITRNEDRQ